MNHKRVERIWRQEGLKVPRRQPKRGRLWLNDGSCIRLRPLHKNHVWSYDFVSTRTHDGRALKLLTVLDEYTRQCLAIKVGRKTRVHDVLEVLTDLFARHGPPEHLRSDNGPEFTVKLVRKGCLTPGRTEDRCVHPLGQIQGRQRAQTGFAARMRGNGA